MELINRFQSSCGLQGWFCIVPSMEGREFTLILCDNNLSALPAKFQDHIVSRYQSAGTWLLDAIPKPLRPHRRHT